ncbi:MAG: right-handed parallel beta-helix repeat-containing protein [Candidatus Cloacimonetes bacterium]|nr:right-handed parallel beta-helix repeat-containing protein [Candidatus Cloacimonadota bacterium]
MKIPIILLTLLSISGLMAFTYYVPADYPTIQEGIDIMSDSDVLLVSPGMYCENIDFLSKRITVASLYYTTQDTSFISQTIIDGTNNGSVVRIVDVGISHPALVGFTIQNGLSNYGGGIYCDYSNATLSHLIIQNNIATGTMATDMGGGVYCKNSSPNLSYLRIENNFGERGGGFYSETSYPVLNNVDFIGNSTDSPGGGCYIYTGTVTISGGNYIANSAVEGGGLYVFYASGFLEGVTFTGNSAVRGGGAISNENSIEFSSENRCNIYLNNVENRYGGSEICSTEPITVYVDTFTVNNPTHFHAYPIENFTFDILHGIQEQVDADLYVSPAGDNNNSGQLPEEPLKTIQYACSIITASSENPHAIYLAEGEYSPPSNDEFFPVNLPPYVSLAGAGREVTILNAHGEAGVLRITNSHDITVSGITLTNGTGRVPIGISCSNSTAELYDLIVSNCGFSENGCGMSLNLGSYYLHNIIVTGNYGSSGAGIGISRCDSVIMDSLVIENNHATLSGGGISAFTDEIHISNSQINNNIAENIAGGIYLSNNSHLFLENVEVMNNQAFGYYAGGIYIEMESVLELSDATIAYNSCHDSGGGLYLSVETELLFDPDVRSNIFLNNASQRAVGADICSNIPVAIIVDTFTVFEPTDYHAVPIENFTFDILNNQQQQQQQDIYVSPEGDNSNSGLTELEPLKTIQYACSIIQADSLNPLSIFLLPGTYSHSSNGEFFPIALPDNVTLTGSPQGGVILDAESNSCAVTFYRSVNNTLSNLKIINGYDHEGAGIYCRRSSPYIYDVTLQNNSVPISSGGAIFIYDGSEPFLSSVKVQYNNAPHGAGIAVHSASATLHDVMIENNYAPRNGGALNCTNANVILQNVTISGNYSERKGGAVYCIESDLSMSNCLVFDNLALQSGGGIYCENNSTVLIQNSTITGNTGQSGSGIHAGDNSSIYLVNDIFWDNTAEEIYFLGSSQTDTFCLVYSDIQDGSNGIIHGNTGIFNITEGNIGLDPQFVSIPDSDFQLQEDSPCIDAGIDFFEYNDLLLVDLDETQYSGIAPDMGCYEYDPVETNELIIQNSKLKIQNYPNPFNPSTKINFSLPEKAATELTIYNIKGQLVRVLVNETLPAGNYTRTWNGCDSNNNALSSGIYLLSLKTDNYVRRQKLTLLK